MRRRDTKNRILRDGEQQKADGRYEYRYRDNDGKRRSIYSWKLVETDKVPAGKKDGLSLREKEKLIQRNLLEGITPNGGDLSVVQLCEKYLLTKTNVRHNTEASYKTTMNLLRKESFGAIRIDKVKISDAKLFLIYLQKELGKSYSSIHSIRGVLRPAFQMAVDDDILRKNPFEFPLATVLVDDKHTRQALTKEQERRFLKFVQEDRHYSRYYDYIYVLFKTGMRISEFCGLTVKSIDFKKRMIHIDHQLQRKRDGTLYCELTKTNAGTRDIPMTDDVYECFRRIVRNRNAPQFEPVIDGYSGFLFYDREQKPAVAMHWEHYFQHIVDKYNKIYRIQIPKVTPHVCRHTYCSNMAKSGMNPKTLQYLMGHSDISVTLNVYTHIGFQDAREEVARLHKERKLLG